MRMEKGLKKEFLTVNGAWYSADEQWISAGLFNHEKGLLHPFTTKEFEMLSNKSIYKFLSKDYQVKIDVWNHFFTLRNLSRESRLKRLTWKK
jgi:hypothetical protein